MRTSRQFILCLAVLFFLYAVCLEIKSWSCCSILLFLSCKREKNFFFSFLFDVYYILWDHWLFYLFSQSWTGFNQSNSLLSYDVWWLSWLSSELHWRDSYFFFWADSSKLGKALQPRLIQFWTKKGILSCIVWVSRMMCVFHEIFDIPRLM